MKKIEKKRPPEFFQQFLKKRKPKAWNDIAEIRARMRAFILDEEQRGQCAYTELTLSDSPDSSHIDHFKKQSDRFFPKNRFDWNNLLVSTNNENYGAKWKDKTIRKKDYNKLVNPTNESPNEYLYFSATGHVEQKNDSPKGHFTIDTFNLNHPALIEQRKIVANTVSQMSTQFSEDELVTLIGKFESTIRTIYKDIK